MDDAAGHVHNVHVRGAMEGNPRAEGPPQPVFAHHSQAAFVRTVTCTRKPPQEEHSG
jgi:hypothetical protein